MFGMKDDEVKSFRIDKLYRSDIVMAIADKYS